MWLPFEGGSHFRGRHRYLTLQTGKKTGIVITHRFWTSFIVRSARYSSAIPWNPSPDFLEWTSVVQEAPRRSFPRPGRRECRQPGLRNDGTFPRQPHTISSQAGNRFPEAPAVLHVPPWFSWSAGEYPSSVHRLKSQFGVCFTPMVFYFGAA